MAKGRPVIVVIEDDAKFRRLLRSNLRAEGYDVFEADRGKSGLVVAATRKPDLIILDLGLPDIDGAEVIAQVRQWWADRPIMVLSGRGADSEKIALLEAGADDYIVKPIALQELLARIRAALRRSARMRSRAWTQSTRPTAYPSISSRARSSAMALPLP